MKNLLNRYERRQITICEYFFKLDEPVFIEQVLQDLSISEKTFLADVDQLHEQFPFMEIERINQYCSLKMDRSNDFKKIYHYFLTESPAFHLLNYLFFQVSLILTDIEEMLLISRTSLYRLIKKINQYFQDNGFNLQISNNPCQILGNEGHYRLFYQRYFSEILSPTNNPLQEIIPSNFYDFYNQCLRQINYQPNFSQYNQLMIAILINVHRISQGYNVEASSWPQMSTSRKDRQNLSSIKEYFATHYKLDPKKLTGFDMFFPYFDNYFAPNNIYLTKLLSDHGKIAKQNQFMKEIILDTCDEFKLDCPNLEDVLLAIHNSTCHHYYFPVNQDFILNYRLPYFKVIQTNFPKFYHYIYHKVAEYINFCQFNANVQLIHHFMDEIFTIWKDLYYHLNHFNKPIKLIILKGYHDGMIDLIHDILSCEFSNQIQISFYDGPNYFESLYLPDRLKSYDLVLAPFRMPKDLHPHCISTNYFLDKTDYENIFNEIVKIRKERNAKRYQYQLT
ncbi:helix-turn-helix domain-containing protein [Vaginisenegalia massiliensis]|uniref:helix-turn-helix domain-containing protein n=1 Tax=Vaginisenegalia massiliensis TaxID=2058294 RepID=UPI000F54BF54|nr:helix-turn-helix domain-containing protein [Vaginisenegalia massiliensis]